jgi:hypothetical protein
MIGEGPEDPAIATEKIVHIREGRAGPMREKENRKRTVRQMSDYEEQIG